MTSINNGIFGTMSLYGDDLTQMATNTSIVLGKAGTFVSKAAPWIDFGSQILEGEDPDDAMVKTMFYMTVGVEAAAYGMSLGSAIPGLGNVAGAVVGFVLGVAFSYVVNTGFDKLYDKYIDPMFEKGAEAVVSFIGDAWEGTSEFIGGVFD